MAAHLHGSDIDSNSVDQSIRRMHTLVYSAGVIILVVTLFITLVLTLLLLVIPACSPKYGSACGMQQ